MAEGEDRGGEGGRSTKGGGNAAAVVEWLSVGQCGKRYVVAVFVQESAAREAGMGAAGVVMELSVVRVVGSV